MLNSTSTVAAFPAGTRTHAAAGTLTELNVTCHQHGPVAVSPIHPLVGANTDSTRLAETGQTSKIRVRAPKGAEAFEAFPHARGATHARLSGPANTSHCTALHARTHHTSTGTASSSPRHALRQASSEPPQRPPRDREVACASGMACLRRHEERRLSLILHPSARLTQRPLPWVSALSDLLITSGASGVRWFMLTGP